MTVNVYVIDTSALIDMEKNTPMDVYVSQWERMSALVRSQRLLAPMKVFKELEVMDDKLHDWAKENREMFKEITRGQIEAVREIMAGFPSLVDAAKKYSADPWIIALAIDMRKQTTFEGRDVIVVTNEKLKGKKVKIPYVCEHFGVPYKNLIEMLRSEGWKF